MMKIAMQQPIITDYRMGVFLLLRKRYGDGFQIYAGVSDFGGSPVSTPEAWRHFKRVQNLYLFGGGFLWQKGGLLKLVQADVAILNANMRMLSNTVVMVLRFMLRRPTLLWGHAKGQCVFADKFRGVYLRMCSGFIAYTESQAEYLEDRYKWLRVQVAANACVHAEDCQSIESQLSDLNSFLYVGRLVPEKKVELLLNAFLHAKKSGLLNDEVRLVFVGDGVERRRLETQAHDSGCGDSVVFVGHVSDVKELRVLYGNAICSVSPGYVGLSATQSFSFGVPMLVAKDEFHSPEIEACLEGFNAEFFASDDPTELALGLERMAGKEMLHRYFHSRKQIAEWTKERYSFEAMSNSFVHIIELTKHNVF